MNRRMFVTRVIGVVGCLFAYLAAKVKGGVVDAKISEDEPQLLWLDPANGVCQKDGYEPVQDIAYGPILNKDGEMLYVRIYHDDRG